MKRFLFSLFTVLLLCACQQKVHTWSLLQTLEYLDFQQSMSRGVDYLGSDADFHYFEHKLEMAPNVRFRIDRIAEYTPSTPMPYRAWFPDRIPVEDELSSLSLIILHDNQPGKFVYWYKGKKIENPSAISTDILQTIRRICLPSKHADINEQALQPIRHHLENKIDADFSIPTSGLPACILELRGNKGTISSDALDNLIKEQP